MKLTFGNEIECMLVKDVRDQEWNPYDAMRGRKIIRSKLSQPLAANCSNACGSKAVSFNLPLHDAARYTAKGYDMWNVFTDSLKLGPEECQALKPSEEDASYDALYSIEVDR